MVVVERKSDFPDVITAQQLAKPWHMKYAKVLLMIRIFKANGIRLGSQDNGRWRIDRDFAVSLVRDPAFEEALEMAGSV